MRNYSQGGQEIGAFFPRSSFESAVDPIGAMVSLWQLRITNDRIGAVFFASSTLKPAPSTRPMEWIEVDLKGKVLGHWESAQNGSLANLPGAALFIRSGNEVLMFDRSAKAPGAGSLARLPVRSSVPMGTTSCSTSEIRTICAGSRRPHSQLPVSTSRTFLVSCCSVNGLVSSAQPFSTT
jgi:hypothetical protein